MVPSDGQCVCLSVLLLLSVSVSVSVGVPDPGLPLFITPLLEAGKIQQARAASSVEPLIKGLVSYAGYLTVDKQFNSNLFFWFFPSQQFFESKPVLLWLQGGPGASSLLGLLCENGPIALTKSGLKENPYSWSKKYNVIYLDNPVGTGFSFTNSSAGYARTQEAVGKGVYNMLLQFFILFPELIDNKFFLTGESYAGKYIPSTALVIHRNNEKSKMKINLQGLFIGNGLVDPVNMLHYGEYLYQIGLLNENGRQLFQSYEATIKELIETRQWMKATDKFATLILDRNNIYSDYTLFNNITGLKQHYNYINNVNDDIEPFVQNRTIRRAIHVGKNTFNTCKSVALALKEDITKSVKTTVETLLDSGYNVLFYNGQLDIICAYPLTENVLKGLQWSGSRDFSNAERSIWTVGSEVAGYCRSGGRLSEVLVRSAGHLVPADQPRWAIHLLDNFIARLRC